MKNRKKGFSLVELLIVLAVMAALIATITPVALNAIKKSKATQVAQNLKTLASSIENKLYVDGSSAISEIANLGDLGRDIAADYSLYIVDEGTGKFSVWAVYSKTDVDETIVDDVLANAKKATSAVTYTLTADQTFYVINSTGNTPNTNTGSKTVVPANSIYYDFNFNVY